jgi:hypothetical protein
LEAAAQVPLLVVHQLQQTETTQFFRQLPQQAAVLAAQSLSLTVVLEEAAVAVRSEMAAPRPAAQHLQAVKETQVVLAAMSPQILTQRLVRVAALVLLEETLVRQLAALVALGLHLQSTAHRLQGPVVVAVAAAGLAALLAPVAAALAATVPLAHQ